MEWNISLFVTVNIIVIKDIYDQYPNYIIIIYKKILVSRKILTLLYL